jgi:hypothetical protein
MHPPLLNVPPVQINGVLAEGHLTQSFDIAVAGHGLNHARRRHLAMRPLTLDDVEQACDMVVEASIDSMGQLLVVGAAGERELLEVTVHHGSGSVRAAADTPAAADALLDRACAALAAEERPEDPRVPITFWTLAEHGPDPMQRRLHAPRWDEIADNYLPPVREALAQIMSSPPDSARGIALWQGVPGTGKTTALRALAQAWRDDVEVHVIVDPEVFLGDRASYLVEVLFGHDVDEQWDATVTPTDGFSHYEVGAMMSMPSGMGMHPGGAFMHDGGSIERVLRRPRAKLIVLEDAGELISADARVSSGQALSRLLNLTDGMLGQGTNVSVLVTTNEPIDRLHSAIARPGRSWAHIEFGELPVDVANAWLDEHECADRVDAPASLAELYGLLRGDQVVTLDTLDD